MESKHSVKYKSLFSSDEKDDVLDNNQYDSTSLDEDLPRYENAFSAPTTKPAQPRRSLLLHLIGLSLVLIFMFTFFHNYGKPFKNWTPQYPDDKHNSQWPPNREFRRHETSQQIKGMFPLYDLLDLQTTSGSIEVTIQVYPGDKPAILNIGSRSGSIKVNIDWSLIQDDSHAARGRRFETSLTSSSGSVEGSVFHGNGGTTTVQTDSGSIGLTLYTFGASSMDPFSTFSTTSHSGSQNLVILPGSSSGGKLTNLNGDHLVLGSASLKARYPTDWEGNFHGSVGGSGHLDAYGSGLEFLVKGPNLIEARRGDGKSQVNCRIEGSGSGLFRC